MFFSRPKFHPVSRASSSTTSSPSLSDIRTRNSSYGLHQLSINDLNEIDSNDRNHLPSRQRDPFRIPRPQLDLSRPSNGNSSPSAIHIYPPAFDATLPARPIPVQYQFLPVSYQRFSPKTMIRRMKDEGYVQEKPPGLCATCCSGGCGAFAVCIYLLFILALPTSKLVLGILYRDECPVNQNIPLYMIVSGSAGIAIVLFLLLSSSCTYCRSSIKAQKATHGLMIFSIAFGRGMQAVLAIFLFVWFFFGNVWVFSVRSRLRTVRSIDGNNENYCHPVLYWPAFYLLIFTYVASVFVCLMKFCARLFCCGACDIWKRAFS